MRTSYEKEEDNVACDYIFDAVGTSYIDACVSKKIKPGEERDKYNYRGGKDIHTVCDRGGRSRRNKKEHAQGRRSKSVIARSTKRVFPVRNQYLTKEDAFAIMRKA